jgi:hypothetical protein
MLFNQRYFAARGYYVRVLTEATGDDFLPSDRRWNKIKAVPNALQSWASNASYLVVFDADLFMLNTTLSMEDTVEQHPRALLIMSEDSMDIGNTGFMIVRNHPWSIQFFETWWSERERSDSTCDQHVLNYLLDSLVPADRANVAILPAKQLNSIWPAIEHFRESDSVLHLMGETNAVRAKVAEYLAAQVRDSDSGEIDYSGDTAAGEEGASRTALTQSVNITKAILRQLKQQVVLQEVDGWKSALAQSNANMSAFHELKEAVEQLCAPNKRSNTKSALRQCTELTEEVIALHEQALLTLPLPTHLQEASVTQLRLFHTSQLSALITEALELSASTAASTKRGKQNVSSSAWQRSVKGVLDAVQRALEAVDRFAAVLDMSSREMQAVIHSKRGTVYSILSKFYAKTDQWTEAAEAEQSAMAELTSALQLTDETSGEFPGLVIEYVHSATRLAGCFQRVGKLTDAVEWADIAVSNALVRFESSANEIRLRAKELTEALALRASLAELQGDASKQADMIRAMDAVSARFVFG